MKRVVLMAGLSFVVARAAIGQTTRSWTFDAAVGGSHGRGGDFIDKGDMGSRLAVGANVTRGRTGLYAELSYDWFGMIGSHDIVCYVSSRGGCKQGYPELSGPAISVGALARPSNRTELRLGLGGAAYEANDTRVGAIIAAADAAAYPAQHIGVVAGFRSVAIPRYRGDRISIRAIMTGIRLRQLRRISSGARMGRP